MNNEIFSNVNVSNVNVSNANIANIDSDDLYNINSEEAIYSNFRSALNNNDIEQMVEYGSFLSYENEFIMKEVIKKDNVEFIQIFIGLGYKIPKYIGSTNIIQYMITYKTPENIKYVIDHIDYNEFDSTERNNNLLIGCKLNLQQVVYKLLEYDYDLNYQDNIGNSYLIWSCAKGNMNLVKKFIELGIDVNLQTNNGFDSFDYAIMNGRTEIAEYLFEKLDITIEKIIKICDNTAYMNPNVISAILNKKKLNNVEIEKCLLTNNQVLLEYTIQKYYDVELDNPLIYYILKTDLTEFGIEILEKKGYDFKNVIIKGNSIFGYIFMIGAYYVFDMLEKYITIENINYRNKEGLVPIMILVESITNDINKIRRILNKLVDTKLIDFMIKDYEGYSLIDHMLLTDFNYMTQRVLHEMNIKLGDYLKGVKKHVFVELLENNDIVYDLISVDDRFNMRDYLGYKNNRVLELGLIHKQITIKDLSNSVIDYDTIANNKILLRELIKLNDIQLVKHIIIYQNHLLDYVNLEVFEDYCRENKITILRFIIEEDKFENNIINTIIKLYTKEKLKQEVDQYIWDKLVENKYEKIIKYFMNCELIPSNSDDIIKKLDIKSFNEKELIILFSGVKDNELLLSYLLVNPKIENIILESAKQNEMNDNCIICYGKESERSYYYKCEHSHNYHFDCLIPYLKKHNMKEMTCFFCKGKMCFREIYKN